MWESSQRLIPGTTVPYGGDGNGHFSVFQPLIRMTDGLSLSQVCNITGLEPTTVQNWIKRGFVPHPVKKKYHERELARVLLISAMRFGMQIDCIGVLLTAVNGDADSEEDDIISEPQLYDYLCEIIRRTGERLLAPEEMLGVIRYVIADYNGPDGASQRLVLALQTMVYATLAGRLKQQADGCFTDLCRT